MHLYGQKIWWLKVNHRRWRKKLNLCVFDGCNNFVIKLTYDAATSRFKACSATI